MRFLSFIPVAPVVTVRALRDGKLSEGKLQRFQRVLWLSSASGRKIGEDVPSTNCAAYLELSAPPHDIPVIDAGNPLYRNGSMKVYEPECDPDGPDEDDDPACDFKRYGHYSVIRITNSFLEVSSASWHATGSVCDAQTQHHGGPLESALAEGLGTNSGWHSLPSPQES